MPSPASPTEGTPDNIAVWFTLLVAAVYVVGWSYLYGYYTTFGLSARAAGLQPYDILIESIRVLQTHMGWVAGLLILVLIGRWCWRELVMPESNGWLGRQMLLPLPDRPPSGRQSHGFGVRLTISAIILVILIPQLFGLCALAGRRDAQQHIQESSPALPPISVEFHADKVPSGLFDPDEMIAGRTVEGYRLLAASSASYFVVRPVRSGGVNLAAPTQILVVEIPRDTVRGVRYLAAQR